MDMLKLNYVLLRSDELSKCCRIYAAARVWRAEQDGVGE